MNEKHEPIEARLAALRPLAWQRDDHQSRLETVLMQHATQTRRGWWRKASIVAGLVLAGGAAGATTMAVIDRWDVDEVDLPGADKLVTITDNETGESETLVVPDDTVFFGIEGGDESDVLLGLTPLDGDPPEDAGDGLEAPVRENE
jgi:hypothetical protein